MNGAIAIIDENVKKNVRHSYDLEVFLSIARLIQHTAQTYLDFSEAENFLKKANQLHYEGHQAAYQELEKVITLLEANIKRRENVFNDLVVTWEKSRLPKGYSTGDKQYFFQQDRARHFANRQPDMLYLIYDEKKLDVEGYLTKIRSYSDYYKTTFLTDNK